MSLSLGLGRDLSSGAPASRLCYTLPQTALSRHHPVSALVSASMSHSQRLHCLTKIDLLATDKDARLLFDLSR